MPLVTMQCAYMSTRSFASASAAATMRKPDAPTSPENDEHQDEAADASDSDAELTSESDATHTSSVNAITPAELEAATVAFTTRRLSIRQSLYDTRRCAIAEYESPLHATDSLALNESDAHKAEQLRMEIEFNSGTQAPQVESSDTFAGLLRDTVQPELISALTECGFHRPSPIQRLALPVALQTQRCVSHVWPRSPATVVAAETGQGKTLVYAIAVLQHALRDKMFMQSLSNEEMNELQGRFRQFQTPKKPYKSQDETAFELHSHSAPDIEPTFDPHAYRLPFQGLLPRHVILQPSRELVYQCTRLLRQLCGQ